MPMIRRTTTGSNDALPPLIDDKMIKEEKRNVRMYRNISFGVILLSVLVMIYFLMEQESYFSDMLDDCSFDLEDCRKDTDGCNEIIEDLEKSVAVLLKDNRRYHSKGGFDSKMLSSKEMHLNAPSRLYDLRDVLRLPATPSNANIMHSFQEKWGMVDNDLYAQCGVIRSRQPAVSHSAKARRKIAVLSSWSPRPCGIATYSSKLVEGLDHKCPKDSMIDVIAVRNPNEPADFFDNESERVKVSFQRDHLKDYFEISQYINDGGYEIVILSYEFGIFGDENIMCLLKHIQNAKIITILHTVAENLPWQKQALTEQVMMLSHKVVVMTETMAREVQLLHQVPLNFVKVIPHGVPNLGHKNNGIINMKKKTDDEIHTFWGFDSAEILFSNGLLHQGKGIEHVLWAMPAILQAHPDAVYVIQGPPHPTGDGTTEYYDTLKNLVEELNLGEHVQFFPHFLPDAQLLGRIQHSRIYINAYVDKFASVSGTLVMAMSTGVPCISTPYPFAREMLTGQRGLLVPFGESKKISEAVIYLLSNPQRATEMGEQAQSQTVSWDAVGEMFLQLAYGVH